MEVEDGLARAAAIIHHDAISGPQLAFRCEARSEQERAAKQGAVFFF